MGSRLLRLGALCVALLSACNIGPKRNYTAPDGEFSCDVPESWSLKDGSKLDLEILSPVQEAGRNARIAIYKSGAMARPEIEKVMAQEKAAYAQDKAFAQVKLHPLHFAIFKGLSYTVTRRGGGDGASGIDKLSRVYFSTPKFHYVIEYGGPEKLFEKYRPAYSRVLNTFRWNRSP